MNIVEKTDENVKDTNITCGILNSGNTCYMNSVIQCITHSKDFRNYMSKLLFVEPLLQNIIKEQEKEQDKNNEIKEKEKVKKKQKISVRELKQKFNDKLIYQLYRVMKGLIKSKNCSLEIDTFKTLFGQKIEMFYGYSQHDTQEALNSLFMTVETEINIERPYYIKNISSPVEELMKKRDYFSKLLKKASSDEEKKRIKNEYNEYKLENSLAVRQMNAYSSWKDYKKKNGNIIVDVFTGYFHIETICPECKIISDRFESFNILPLTIVLKEENKVNKYQNTLNFGNNWNRFSGIGRSLVNEEVNIDICFENLFKEEKLDNDNKWNCPTCCKKVNAIRKFYIWKKPKVLIVLLKRFDENHFKITNKVNFPIYDLSLEKYQSYLNENDEDINKNYNLFAISNHVGNMFGGHHYAYCKTELEDGDNWFLFNDEDVRCIYNYEKNSLKDLTNDIVSKNAYLLFYEL